MADLEKIHAQRLVDLIKSGKSDEEASRELGIPPPALRSATLKKQILDLMHEAYIPADVTRAGLRAARIKAFFDLLEKGLGGDLAAMKLAAEFSKQIGMDPEVALNQAPQTTVNIDVGELKDVLEKIDASEVINVVPEKVD